MATTAYIYCKTCQKKTKHWDNTGTPKEKELGKFVCSICKTPFNPKPRDAQPAPVSSTAPKQETPKKLVYPQNTEKTYRDYGEGVPKSMYGAWANNLVLALIEKGVVKTKAEAVTEFKKLVAEYGVILNGTSVVAKPEIPVATAPEPAEEIGSDVDQMIPGGIDDLDLDDINI